MKITGFKLSRKVDITLFKYNFTDMLACHDDVKETRKIAFILYIVPEDWSEEDGGNLELFGCDGNLVKPKSVVRKIAPKANTLALFEVSNRSFHAVSEVLSHRPRYSITGWFHVYDDDVLQFPGIIDPMIPLITGYLNPYTTKISTNQNLIATLFTENGYQLKSFLNISSYHLLKEELCSNKIEWTENYVPNSHNYHTCDYNKLGACGVLSDLLRLFSSESFLRLLPGIGHAQTPKIHPHHDPFDREFLKSPKLWLGSLKKLKTGSFCILSDYNFESFGDHFDIFFHLIDNKWNSEFGGSITYHNPSSGLSVFTQFIYQ
uniref:Prolyl 3-hydroxylase OGFOD1 (Trinotate prediction) n=1 Tax=Myxobolus squamalis TaxID=59785 RepID=A0A6B2G3F0_MYXSQ